MIKIDVRADISKALAKLTTISNEVRDKAVVRALNKTATQVKTQAAREIRDVGYNLKIGKIKQSIDIRRASKSTLVAVVKASGRPIGLINYAARQTKSGVSVQVKGGRKVINGAFIATMPSGHKGVFVRLGDAHKKVTRRGKVRWSGLPIKELFGPSIPVAFLNKTVQSALQLAAREKFPRILQQEIAYLRLKS